MGASVEATGSKEKVLSPQLLATQRVQKKPLKAFDTPLYGPGVLLPYGVESEKYGSVVCIHKTQHHWVLPLPINVL